jgi:hypothetical protein
MASPLDPVTPGEIRPPVPTITSQVQEDLPSLAEARQVEQLMGAKPNLQMLGNSAFIALVTVVLTLLVS